MEKAVSAVRDGRMSLREAEAAFNISHSTISRYMSTSRPGVPPRKKKLGRPPTLPPDVEANLLEFALKLDQMSGGLTVQTFLARARAYAKEKGITWSSKSDSASYSWFHSFNRRMGGKLSMRRPQMLELRRAAKPSTPITRFFKDFGAWHKQHTKFKPFQVYNVDEIIFSGSGRVPKVIAARGERDVHAVDAEGAPHIAAIVCGNAEGQFLPTYFVIKNGQTALAAEMEACEQALPNLQTTFSDSGWVDAAVWREWVEKIFIPYARPSTTMPLLLLLDGLRVHDDGKANGMLGEHNVHRITFPSNQTSRLQPLDVGVFAPLKQQYNNWRVERHLQAGVIEQGTTLERMRVITGYLASERAATAMVNAFRHTGVWPFDPTQGIPAAERKRKHQRQKTKKAASALTIPEEPVSQKPRIHLRVPKRTALTPEELKAMYKQAVEKRAAKEAKSIGGGRHRKKRAEAEADDDEAAEEGVRGVTQRPCSARSHLPPPSWPTG